jgi:hypothetical protein
VSPEYAAWIAENVDEPYGKCREWSRAMASFYPELRVARGWYDDPIWGQREHWWCVTPAGEIVDPTAAQFPTRGMFPYREITDESEVPTGACLTCGDPVYEGAAVCSDSCAGEASRYYAISRESFSVRPLPSVTVNEAAALGAPFSEGAA